MKRMISILISVLMLSSVMLLVSCGKPEDDKTHDEVFQEIADLSREKNEKRGCSCPRIYMPRRMPI